MPGPVTHPAVRKARPWELLRAQVSVQAAGLTGPLRPGPGRCVTCHGPSRPGYARCFQCGLHAESAPGLLADVVVPVAYALKGRGLAQALWRYKSGRAGAQPAQRMLRALLLVFLRDHGPCVWRTAGMPPPTHVSVVPSGRGRPGTHPLATLIGPYLARPAAPLRVAGPADPGCRDLDPGRFQPARPLPGASVLLLDDTWTSGASAQSAAIALRAAGAGHVAVVVLGRHLSAGDLAASAACGPGHGEPFRLEHCAVHQADRLPGRR
jgi:hypothetical protein